MPKKSATDTLEAQKEKLQEIINKLADQYDLSDEDLNTIKEWGIALLITGASAYIIYRILQGVFGFGDDEEEIEEEPEMEEDEDEDDYDDPLGAITGLLKGQVGVFLVSLARRQITRFLRENNLLDEDE